MGSTYTRQSSTEIVDGEVIQASDFNNEFEQLVSAFAVSTGHSHDGTTAEGGPVTKLLGTAITIGDGTSGTDIAVTFDGETGDGVLTWMEDEDYFKFSDDILINSTEKVMFQDTGTYIYSNADGDLDLVSDGTAIDSINIESAGGITLDAGSTTHGITYEDDGTAMLQITNSSSDVIIKPLVDAKDIIFQQYDGTEVARIEDNATFNVSSASKFAYAGTAVTSTAAELNILDGVTSTAAELNILDGVTTTAAELNLIDGGTSRGTTAVASGDGILINDAGTMAMTNVDTVSTYFASHSVGGSNIVTTGALDSGSITSGFGAIDNGASNITSGGLVKLDVDADADDLTGDSSTGRLTIGASEDLNLYHGGTNSYIVNDTGDLILDTADDIVLDADGGDIFFKDGGTTFGSATNTSGDLIIKSGTTTAMTFSGANVTFAGTVTIGSAGISETELELLDGATVTTAELNLIDGGTSRGTTAVASGDGILINDAGTMAMTNVDTVSTYFASHSVGGSNIVTTGALDSGSITSGFGAIDNGTSGIRTDTFTAETSIVPDASAGADIGTASLEWGDVYIADDKYIKFGSDQNIIVGYDEDGNDSLEFKANVEGAALALTFSADEADDNADTWKLNFADSGTITWQSYTSGSFATKQTLDTSGNLTLTGTYSGGGLMTTGGNIVIPNAGNIGSASDTDAIAIASDGVVTMNQIPVFSAGINVSGGSIAGTLSTAAQGNVTSLGTLTTLTVDSIIVNGTTIGHTSATDAMTVSSGGIVTFKDDIVLKDAGTIGNATTADLIHLAAAETVFNEGSADLDFRVESNANQHMFFIDGGNNEVLIDGSNGLTTSDGLLHLHRATGGSISASALADELVIENSDHSGVSILTPADKHGYIMFGDTGSATAGQIQYDHGTPAWQYIFEGTNRMYFIGTETVFNEEGADHDFRVEGDTNANLLHVNAGADSIGIGTNESADTEMLRIQDGTTTGTAYDLIRLNGGGNANMLQRMYQSVSTSAVTLATETQLGTGGGMTFVSGGADPNTFSELVVWCVSGGTPAVVGSVEKGSPSARTYSQSGVNLQVLIATGTVNMNATTLWNRI